MLRASYVDGASVFVSGSINGLQPGPHAFHVHEIGSTDGEYYTLVTFITLMAILVSLLSAFLNRVKVQGDHGGRAPGLG